MPGFDPSLDKELFSESAMVGPFRLKVSVMQYNDGEPKLHLSRERISQSGEPTFSKLGRLTLEEATAMLPLFQKAKEFLDNNSKG